MSTFVLVHGAHLGSWSWNLVITSLQRRGHQAINIDLPIEQNGLGAADYAKAIDEQIKSHEIKDDLVVVGHAMAGLIIPLLANTQPVRKCIYLAPLLPIPEKSIVGRLKADEKDMLLVNALPNPVTDRASAFKYWLHDCEPDIAYWAASRFRPQSYENILTEITPVTKLPEINSAVILCTNDRIINAKPAENLAKNLLRSQPIAIDSGHCPQLSRPQELALLLMQLGNTRNK